jgi:hypothetical protein
VFEYLADRGPWVPALASLGRDDIALLGNAQVGRCFELIERFGFSGIDLQEVWTRPLDGA